MSRPPTIKFACILFFAAQLCGAMENDSIRQRETLTNDLCGLKDNLSDKGLDVSLSATQIYQQNARGGVSTHRRAGRYSGSYDVELEADFEKLFGIEGGRLYMLTEGKWSKSAGINGPAVGSFFNVNGDSAPRRAMDVTELWYEQIFSTQTLTFRFGKIDLTCGFEHHNCPVSFDCSNYANDETTQFLNGALKNNPTIPFPDNGLGAALHYGPDELWYISAAVADAQADYRETGFRTAFCGEDHFFYITETGITPALNSANGALRGAYRIGLWYDPQPKASTDLADAGKSYRDDVGFYITCDQMLTKENTDPQDRQGFGLFLRYGKADGKRNDITDFWNFGFQYQGLFDSRDDDVLGVGFAHGTLSNKASATYTNDYESAFEVYYSAKIASWMVISPDFQYIINPGGDRSIPDAVIVGARVQMAF
ncbi:MAG: carbohydrate porin [Sedimentisphaerales bacterium]|nr:carbohydrate porin [Sedimentisphaerales bacterium]